MHLWMLQNAASELIMDSNQLRALAHRVEQRSLTSTDVLYLQRLLLREAQARETPKMREDDVAVHYVDGDTLMVFAKFSGFNKTWPYELTHEGRVCAYLCNHPMPDFAAGVYGG